MTEHELNPYVGPRPFERKREDSARFFGRSQETEEIVSLIFGHPVILIYAQSGAGKTSLFNASVTLKLEENGFDVLPLTRVGGIVPKGVALQEIKNLYVFNALLKMDSETDPRTLLSKSLSTFLETRVRMIDENDQPRPRVIIFDQFEELFTYTPERWREQRDGFFLQVVEVLNADPRLRVVFVIREDFLAELDPYARNLPERLRTRYRLERLGENAALRAIKDPLAHTSRTFAPGVAEALVRELLVMRTVDATGKTAEIEGQYVEPVQLQVICVTLWSALESDVTEIQTTHLENFNVNDALSDFYKSTIDSAAKESGVPETNLRNWFEKILITPMGTRSTVFRGEDSTGGIENSAVDFLESRHIIRAEFRAGVRWYELTHDRLVEPIIANNKKWEDQHFNFLQRGAALWDSRERSDGLLLRGKELREAEVWTNSNIDYLSFVEKEYLNASRKLKAQEDRERNLNRWLVVLTSIAVIVAGVARSQWSIAQQQRATAVSSAATAQASDQEAKNHLLRSESLRMALQSKMLLINDVNSNTELAALLSIRSLNGVYIPEADTALVESMNRLYAVYTFEGHKDEIQSIAVSPNGKYMATGSEDKTAKLWDIETGELVRTFEGHANWITSVSFSPDGKYILTGSFDDTAKIWDVSSGAVISTLSGHNGTVLAAAYSPDGNFVLTGSNDNTAKLWDARTGKELRIFIGHEEAVRDIAFSASGDYVLTGSDDDTAKLWDFNTGKEIYTFKGYEDDIYSVAFSPDDKQILVGGRDIVAVWDLESREKLLTLTGHRNTVNDVAFSNNGNFILTGSFDGTAILWNSKTGKILRTFSGHSNWVNEVVFSPDDRYVFTGSADATAKMWLTSEVRVPRVFATDDEINKVVFSPDGKSILTAGNNGYAKTWSIVTGIGIRTYIGHTDIVDAVSMSPDGKYILTGSLDKSAKLWDVETGEEVHTYQGHTSSVWSVAISPNALYVLTGSADSTAKLWDMNSGKEIRVFEGHDGGITTVAFSPDGKYILTGSADNTAKLWDAETGKEIYTIKHSQSIRSVAFSPDGEYILTGSIDVTARLWDAKTGKEKRVFKGHADRVLGVAFSSDGKYILTGSADNTAKLWETETGKEIRTLAGHTGYIYSVAFSPDVKYLATASADGTARLWDFDYHATIELACSVLTRDLTNEERERYEILEDSPTCPP